MTPMSPPDFTFPESTLDPILIHNEIESPILKTKILYFVCRKSQSTNWQVPMEKLASSHFYEIETNEICDLDSQICDPVQLSESILTPFYYQT